MKAVVRQLEGLSFAARSDSRHWIVMDTDPELGGQGAGTKPLELVLIGLGGCTGMDVASILAKMRMPFDRIEVSLDADRSEDHPKVLTRIRMEYHVYGVTVEIEKVQKAVELSRTKYCTVSAMLTKAVPIEYRIRVHSGGEEKEANP